MNVSITLKEAPFPSMGETIVYPLFSDSLTKDPRFQELDRDAKGRLSKKASRMEFSGNVTELLSIDSVGMYQNIVVVGLGDREGFTPTVLRDRVADAVRYLNAARITGFHIVYTPELGKDHAAFAEAVALGVLLGDYRFSRYKSHEFTEKESRVTNVEIHVDSSHHTKQIRTAMERGIDRARLMATGTVLTRDLVNEPSSHLSPAMLAREARKIAEESRGRVSVSVMGEAECEKMGMGAFLGVGQGSDNEAQFIVLRYHPGHVDEEPEQLRRKICLIGKSVTFDSGGYSLKPAEYMEDMKIDMAGGAAVLGTFRILAEWDEKRFGEIPYEVYGILPACDNMVSGKAFKPGDVLTAMNGKTIEVLNTDAEGRLTLGDALVYAERELKAHIAIDFATLTGAAMVALGTDIAAVFGNDRKLTDTVLDAARKHNEPAWELPLSDLYADEIKGEVADMKNLPKTRYGGAISAALFLREFVGDMKWVHADIAGSAYNMGKPRGAYPKGATGWGVATLIQVLTTPDL
jgi:leucyl aminopeptidase